MARYLAAALMATALVVANTPVLRAEITAAEVQEALDRGVTYLKRQQDPDKGNWPEYPLQAGGLTALCTLAMLNSGVPVDDPAVQRSLEYLRGVEKPSMTYTLALQTMVFCAAEPEKDRLLIRRNVKLLESSQITSGDTKGAWTYGGNTGTGDNSNSQFALMGLYEAQRIGIDVDERTWRLAQEYWSRIQKADGSWGYAEGHPSSGSMTCAGIAALIITGERLSKGDARVEGGRVLCCGAAEENNRVENGIRWLAKHFSVRTNPGGRVYVLYYLYGLERVGRFTGSRFIGDHDWYREGAEYLVAMQDKAAGYWKGEGHSENNPVVATSLALLFLSKGRRPVVVAQVKHGEVGSNDWNAHRGGVHNLTQYTGKRWKRDLSWQNVNLASATVDDLLESPVLFLSGQAALRLSEAEKRQLVEYVNRGGFIFAEACDGNGCDGAEFDRSFRAVIEEMFKSKLQPLRADHPIWYADQRIEPSAERPLLGVEACCRTSVVYCPKSLSCYWELARPLRVERYGGEIEAEINEACAIGANVLAYATNREPRYKLDRPTLARDGSDQNLVRGTLYVAKLDHGGGADDAPNALGNLLLVTARQTGLRIAQARADDPVHLVPPGDPDLFKYPILFMHGRRGFRFSDAERSALASHLERGGILFADSICASTAFADSFRAEISAMFPDQKLVRLPAEHPLYSRQYGGYDVSSVSLRDPLVRGEGGAPAAKISKTAPYLEGLEIDGRLAVVFSPYDISCAMENHASVECKGYVTDDAAKLGVNILLYALQQ